MVTLTIINRIGIMTARLQLALRQLELTLATLGPAPFPAIPAPPALSAAP
jgi:hypothetical protein